MYSSRPSASLCGLAAAVVLLGSACSLQHISPGSETTYSAPANNTTGIDGSTTGGSGGTTTTGGAASTGSGTTTGTAGTTTGATTGTTAGATTGTTQQLTTFAQGAFRGQDPRVSQRNGYYYYVGWIGQDLMMFKSKSLVDLGVGKPLPSAAYSSLFAPIYIDTMNGQTINAWFMFGPQVWRCDCTDPYDNIDQWRSVGNNPSGGFDFEVFQNPQDGPYKGNWYLLYTAIDSGYAESIYITALSLTGASAASSYIITHHTDGSAWTDIIVEAPGAAINGTSVSFGYSGNGAQTSLYSVGLAILRMGQDPLQPSSWIDYSHSGCSGNVHDGPEMTKTANVLGPGVVRFFKSPDGTQDWMVYHAKVWDTWDRTDPTPEPAQYHNEEYTRYVNFAPFSWQQVSCDGVTYSVPKFPTPASQGTVMNLPSGDPGPTKKTSPLTIEAEYMVPFGEVAGPTIRGICGVNNGVLACPSSVALNATASNFSRETKFFRLADLSTDVATSPKQSGLIFRNAPGGSSLTVASASTSAANLDLYINGTFKMTLSLPSTGDVNTFHETNFNVSINNGDEIKLVYQAGKSATADLDYIKINP